MRKIFVLNLLEVTQEVNRRTRVRFVVTHGGVNMKVVDIGAKTEGQVIFSAVSPLIT